MIKNEIKGFSTQYADGKRKIESRENENDQIWTRNSEKNSIVQFLFILLETLFKQLSPFREVAVQAKIEKDRIFDGMEKVSNLMNAKMAKKRYSLSRNEKLKSLKFFLFL